MKLRTQIISLGLVGAFMAASVGGIGLAGTSRLAAGLEAAIGSSVALQASQEADMMHDAVRGDVLLALMGAQKRDPARIAEARKDLQAHAQTFQQALAKMQSLPLPLPPTAKDIVAKTLPLVNDYIGAAESTIDEAEKDVDGGEKAVPSFQAKFGELEKQMAEQSDAIEASNVELNAQAQAALSRSALEVGIACLVAAVGMVFAAWWLARHMARPMAHAVGVADRLAQGDLTAEARPMGNDETLRLLESLARMRGSFADIVQHVKSNADSVATASAHIAQGNQDLSSRTEQQASALQQTTATMDLLGSTVSHNADSAKQANQLAQGASAVAARGGEVVSQVVSTMKGIDESSRRIADIIAVIDGIAFQTNILALNAAVEAARAGEQGRGFAVVAGEVRSLAQRSAQAAREIKSLITASVEQVSRGTTLVDQAGRTMNEVVGSIRRVSDIVGEIAAASQEQSSGVSQVGQAVSQMDQATQQNAALVEESAAAAESLKEQAKMLVQAVAAFKLGHGAAA